MRTKQILLAVLLVGSAVSLGGCVVAAVGAGAAGTVAYLKGDLEAVESRKLDEVHAATLKAVKELGLNVTQDTKDALSAVIITRDAQDKKVKITLRATTEQTTKLSIRVGLFGSEAKSRLIYQKIHDYLQK
ncbi:MAG: DUF3568 family protein [Phycisphaerae bacterium]